MQVSVFLLQAKVGFLGGLVLVWFLGGVYTLEAYSGMQKIPSELQSIRDAIWANEIYHLPKESTKCK